MDVSIDLGLENDTEKMKLEMNAEYVLSENDHYFDKVKFKILQNVAS